MSDITSIPALIGMHSEEQLFSAPVLTRALEILESQAGGLVGDPSTEAGRREIERTARAVGGAISRLDEMRREYVAALKARPAAIDKLFRETFREPAERIKDAIRAPLVRWQEERREEDEEFARVLTELEAPVVAGTLASDIERRIAGTRALAVPDWLRPEQCEAIAAAKDAAIARLEAALAAAVQSEVQAAELAMLRTQAAERERADREAQIARDAAERATREAEDRGRLQQAAAEARARDIAEIERRKAQHYESWASINRDVLDDLIAIGLNDGQGRDVITAVSNGKIRHVRIEY